MTYSECHADLPKAVNPGGPTAIKNWNIDSGGGVGNKMLLHIQTESLRRYVRDTA